MISFEEAFKKVISNARILGIKQLSVDKALGYILAEDIKAERDMPPFNKSAMDGYAVRSADLDLVPARLKCRGIIKAGGQFRKGIKKGECIKIMTGSPLPKGTDSVVMVEYTKKENNNRVKILRALKKYENVCFKGEDVQRGSVVLKKGTLVRGPEVAIASGTGRKKVKVFKKPSAAILNTGDEIIEPGNKLGPANIYNSNGPMLLSLLNALGIETNYLGIAGDTKEKLKKAVRQGLKSDIFLLSGGVSAGDYDLAPDILKSCGVKRVFHKVSIKPGKPVFFGTKQDRLIFGVPGNPVSTYLVFLLLIKPTIEKMSGRQAGLFIRRGRLMQDFKQRPGRKHFVPAKAVDKAGKLCVFPVKGYHGSADMASVSRANAFMIIDGRFSFLKKGSRVEVVEW